MSTKNLLASIAFVLLIAVGFLTGVVSMDYGKTEGAFFILLGLANIAVGCVAAFSVYKKLGPKEK